MINAEAQSFGASPRSPAAAAAELAALQSEVAELARSFGGSLPPELRSASQWGSVVDGIVRSVVETESLPAEQVAAVGAKLLMRGMPDLECPLHLQCPITMCLLEDPVAAPSGHSYSRAAIVEYIRRYGRCPMTRARLTVDSLIPNRALNDAVHHHQELFNLQ